MRSSPSDSGLATHPSASQPSTPTPHLSPRASPKRLCIHRRRPGKRAVRRSSRTRRSAAVALLERPCWSSSRAPTRRARRPRAGTWRSSGPATPFDPHRYRCSQPEAGCGALLSDGDAEVVVGAAGSDASPVGALHQAALQEIRLVDVLDRVARLAEGHGDRTDPHRPAVELLDDEREVLPVYPVEPESVHTLHRQRRPRSLLVHRPLAYHLSVVAHPPQEPVGDAWSAAASGGELVRARFGYRDLQDPRVPDHDLLEVLGRVVIEPGVEAEAVEKGLRHQARARRGTDQCKAGHVHPDRAGRGALPEHDVHCVVLHRGVEDLLDLAVQAMDLVYEQEVTLLELGEDRRHVPRPLQARPPRGPGNHPPLAPEYPAQRGLAQTWRPREQHMVQSLPPPLRR